MTGDYVMTESVARRGIELCLKKVRTLLADARVLANNNGGESAHALGLYTFAIEEFGKAILLKECYDKRQPHNDVCVAKWIFAKGQRSERNRSHLKKVLKAYEVLPRKCGNCQMGIVIEKSNGKTRRVKTSHGTMVIPKSSTGLVSYNGPADFEVRMQSFYVDWDEEHREWKYEMTSSNNDLVAAIDAFYDHLTTQPLLT